MEKLVWTTVKRKISELVPYQYNPRILKGKQAKDLKKSIEKFNFVEIPAVNLDGTILAGHQRLSIMKAMGRSKEIIDVRMPNRQLTDKEIQEYNIRSNKNIGEWDFDVLANAFEIDDLQNWGFELSDLNIEEEQAQKPAKEPKKCPTCGCEL